MVFFPFGEAPLRVPLLAGIVFTWGLASAICANRAQGGR